jgi:hypothetical protein
MIENQEPEKDGIGAEEKKPEVLNESKRTRQVRETKFPLPDSRMSLEKQIKVLKALDISSGKGKNPVSAKDVAPITGMHPTLVSGALAFFQKINALVSDKNYTYLPTKETTEFCNELEWNPDGAGEFFKKIIISSWFGDYAVKLFKLQPEMDKNELIVNLGKFSSADKDYHQAALYQVISYLEYSNMIEFDETTKKYKLTDSNLEVLNSKKPITNATTENSDFQKSNNTAEKLNEIPQQIKLPFYSKSHEYPFVFNINLDIDERSDVMIISKKVTDLINELDSLGNYGRASNS